MLNGILYSIEGKGTEVALDQIDEPLMMNFGYGCGAGIVWLMFMT